MARGQKLFLTVGLTASLWGCGYTRSAPTLPDKDGGLSAREAPGLSRAEKAGTLPPLAQRLPRDPLIVHCAESPGYYGGVWHMMVDNPDLGMYKMIGGYAPLVRWKADCSGLEPGTATSWEYNHDGTQLTLHLRHGLRWSDGVEFTSEDFAYWAKLCHEGKQRVATPFWSRVGGREMHVSTPDKYTIVMKFAGPNWYVPLHLATGFWWSDDYNMPKHYLKQFDPEFNPQFRDYSVFDTKNLSHFNPDRPTLWPWKLTSIEDGGFRIVLDRNPYYYVVDSLGRQLPYIDRVILTYVPDPQVRVLKLISGEIDAQFRLIELQDYSLYARGRKTGGYRMIRWLEASGGNSSFLVNWSPPDPGLRDLFRDTRFRRALSLAVDRRKCNAVAWRGLGTPQQATVSAEAWHFQTPEGRRVFQQWTKSWAAFDVPQANRMLDEMGLVRRDSAGYRLRPDGSRLSIMIDVSANSAAGPETDEALIVADGWRKLGIDVDTHTFPAAEYTLRQKLGKFQISIHGESEMDLFTYPDWVFPTADNYWHAAVGKWYMTGGKEGEAPTGPLKRLLDIYARIMHEKDIKKAHQLVLEAVKIHIQEGPFAIGTAARLPSIVIAKDNFRNIPSTPRILGPWAVSGPATSFPETFFFAPPGWRPTA